MSRICFALLFGVGCMISQELPRSARKAIDNRFAKWASRPAHLTNPCDVPGRVPLLVSPVCRCNLNGDGIPDYAVALTTGRDSSDVEYFVALVSNKKRYDLFIIDSARSYQGAGERLFKVILAGDSTTCIEPEPEIARNGKLVDEGQMIVFSTDALEVLPGCEATYKAVEIDAYVMINGRLLSFSAAD